MIDYLEEIGKTALTINTPLDFLFNEYRKKRADIDRISDYVYKDADVMDYFLHGAQKAHRYSSITAESLFDKGPAFKCLDAEFWSRAMQLTDVLETMDATRRNEWSEHIRNHTTPPFDLTTVVDTMNSLLAQRALFFTERVCGLFRNLSEEHITNQPQGFSKRMIVGYLLTNYDNRMFTLNHGRANYLHDLRCVIAKFMGRDAPHANATWADLLRIIDSRIFGEWFTFDGGAFKVRLYMKGTAHLEVHPDIAWRLNRILANKFPNAIPESFRRKPVKAKVKKEYELQVNLVSFEAIQSIESGRLSKGGQKIWFTDAPPKQSAVKVMEYLGGTQRGTDWEFDYDITLVLKEIARTGALPEQVSHQFYGTPEHLAKEAVAWAEIGETHTVLEPSAGQGGIADHLPKERTTCVEISELHCAVLKAKGMNVVCFDFLDWNSEALRSHRTLFDRVVLNPPFSGGRAELHVTYAASMLKPGGILVAILPASFKDKKLVGGMSHEWSEIYRNEFKDASVNVVMLKLRKSA